MADLLATTVSGGAVSATRIYPSGSGLTEWVRLWHCADADSTAECNPTYSCAWLHVRTPLPATNEASGIGWNPSILEVVGFHTYSGEATHDFMAVTNNSGYADNTWYGSQIRVNDGNTGSEAPVVYQSTNTYGGYKRVCFALRKIGCCCVGWLWIRYRNQTGYRTNFAWATAARNTTANYF